MASRFALAWLWLLPLAALADSAARPVTMWVAEGSSNRVYILGSVHLLRAQDHPLPQVIDDAYDDAETLYMELDMDDIDPLLMQATINQLGMLDEAIAAGAEESTRKTAQRAVDAVRDEVDAAIERVLGSGRLILGPEVEAFEREFAVPGAKARLERALARRLRANERLSGFKLADAAPLLESAALEE